MARRGKISIRLSEDERREIQEASARLEFTGPSAFIRHAIHRELAAKNVVATDTEERVAATLDRVVRDVARVVRAQQVLIAIVDTLVKTFLTCIPDPPAEGMPQSVARAKDRYTRFVKSAGQAMAGDALAVIQELVKHVE